MTTTDYLAWIGAITGTLALAWDIFKWVHGGVRLSFKAVAVGMEEPEGIKFEICNRGGKPTTIQEVMLMIPQTPWFLQHYRLFDNRISLSRVAPKQIKLPALLQPGEVWTAIYMLENRQSSDNWDRDYLKLLAENNLCFEVKSSHSNWRTRNRVKPISLFGFE